MNTVTTGSENGFTFTEILIALSIMTLGFLAMAQMQFLSLRQKQLAEAGTVATNIIQFIADRDMGEVRRTHLLNSIAFMEAQAGRLNPSSASEPHLQYCIGEKNLCDECPCDPLAAITPDPSLVLDDDGGNVPETFCAVINPNEFDPSDVEFSTDETDCDGVSNGSLVVVKRVAAESDNDVDGDGADDSGVPLIFRLRITYAVKSPRQFDETGFDSVSTRDTLASQDFIISGHREDWTEILGAGWGAVNVPHIP